MGFALFFPHLGNCAKMPHLDYSSLPLAALFHHQYLNQQQLVTGVKIEKIGKESIIKADTIIFTGDWIPDHELARRAGFAIDDSHKSPITNNDGQIPNTTIYTVGNLILPIKGADKCAIDARKVARKIAKKIK